MSVVVTDRKSDFDKEAVDCFYANFGVLQEAYKLMVISTEFGNCLDINKNKSEIKRRKHHCSWLLAKW